MQRNKKRKGFTLTELAIVIAVIAILIAVLVPTFVSLINKAEESADKQLVKNLNTVISTSTEDINKPSDALSLVYKNGYAVDNLTPRSDGYIVYDELTTSFVYFSNDGSEKYPAESTVELDAHTTWVFVETSDAEYDSTTNTYTITGTNSAILKGDDWNGANVVANYGVDLYDITDKVILKSVSVAAAGNQQTSADNVSLAKTAVKKAAETSTKKGTITIYVKTYQLSYTTHSDYDVADYSIIYALLTVKGEGAYLQYGTTTAYDISEYTITESSKIEIYNEEQAKNIEEGNVALFTNETTSTNTASDCISDNTGTVTDTIINSLVPTITYSNAVEITVEENGSVTYTIDNTAITVNVETTLSSTATSSGLGIKDYPYLISDVSKINSDGYYKLTDNVDITSTLEISNNVVLDLNGYAINYAGGNSTYMEITITVNSGYALTIDDNSEAKTGKITISAESTSFVYAIYNNGGMLTVNGGTITGTTSGCTILCGIDNVNSGTVTINGGAIDVNTTGTGSATAYGISNPNGGGNISISNCTINAEASGSYPTAYGIHSNSTAIATITNATITSTITGSTSYKSAYGVYNYGTMNITGGNITCTTGSSNYTYGAYNDGGTLTIENVKITCTSGNTANGVYSQNGGSVTISGDDTEITAISIGYNSAYGVYNKVSTLTINGGTIEATHYDNEEYSAWYNDVAIYCYSGKLVMTGGNASSYSALKSFEECEISGGTFDGELDIRSTYTITGGTFSADPTDYVAEGHKVTTTDSTYTVSAD